MELRYNNIFFPLLELPCSTDKIIDVALCIKNKQVVCFVICSDYGLHFSFHFKYNLLLFRSEVRNV